MSINIETSTDSMSQSLDLLKVTTNPVHLHRIWVEVDSLDSWYSIIKQATAVFGPNNWRGQSHIRRKFTQTPYTKTVIWVWFDIPDLSFCTWIVVKLGVKVRQ